MLGFTRDTFDIFGDPEATCNKLSVQYRDINVRLLGYMAQSVCVCVCMVLIRMMITCRGYKKLQFKTMCGNAEKIHEYFPLR